MEWPHDPRFSDIFCLSKHKSRGAKGLIDPHNPKRRGIIDDFCFARSAPMLSTKSLQKAERVIFREWRERADQKITLASLSGAPERQRASVMKLSAALVGATLLGATLAAEQPAESLCGGGHGAASASHATSKPKSDSLKCAGAVPERAHRLFGFKEEKHEVVAKTKAKEGKEKCKKKAPKVKRESKHFNAVAMEVPPEVLEELAKDPGVLVDFGYERHATPLLPATPTQPAEAPTTGAMEGAKRKKAQRSGRRLKEAGKEGAQRGGKQGQWSSSTCGECSLWH